MYADAIETDGRENMAPGELFNTIFQGILTLLMGVVGYFLKRTMNEHDALKKEVDAMKTGYATKSEIKELTAKIDKISDDVDEVKLSYITKDDFFRSMARVESTLERMEDKLEKRTWEK
jgi:predicted  nucleic acid-binding Zn-ribbon protein